MFDIEDGEAAEARKLKIYEESTAARLENEVDRKRL